MSSDEPEYLEVTKKSMGGLAISNSILFVDVWRVYANC